MSLKVKNTAYAKQNIFKMLITNNFKINILGIHQKMHLSQNVF